MSEKKKKTYFVKCTVDMCANEERSVIVKATKPRLAMQKAESECRNNGHFHARAFYCNEMEAKEDGRRKIYGSRSGCDPG
jgi:hypothetical protein